MPNHSRICVSDTNLWLAETELNIQVEYSITPVVPAGHDQPASGGEIEILDVRPFTEKPGGKRQWLECPQWLTEILLKAIDEEDLDGHD
jgi:hypothetical protein